jgi:hypothetical protein
MDVIAGILTLNEINRYIFKYSYKFFLWFIPISFKKYYNNIINYENGVYIRRVSISQINYLLIIGYLAYIIYDNIVTEHYFIPIKFVCYSVLVYSTILAAYSTAKYSIAIKEFKFKNLPIFLNTKEE